MTVRFKSSLLLYNVRNKSMCHKNKFPQFISKKLSKHLVVKKKVHNFALGLRGGSIEAPKNQDINASLAQLARARDL